VKKKVLGWHQPPPLSSVHITTRIITMSVMTLTAKRLFSRPGALLSIVHCVLNTPLRPRADFDSTVCRFRAFWPRLNARAGVRLCTYSNNLNFFLKCFNGLCGRVAFEANDIRHSVGLWHSVYLILIYTPTSRVYRR